jgi:hypothetical protein
MNDSSESVNPSPHRVQLQRTKGWRKPDNTVVVARPSQWGNGYKAMRCGDGWSVFAGRLEWWIERVGIVSREEAVAESIRLFRLGVERWAADEFDSDDPVADALAELRGKNLACWCPLEDAQGNRVPCHADVLLDLANREVQ